MVFDLFRDLGCRQLRQNFFAIFGVIAFAPIKHLKKANQSRGSKLARQCFQPDDSNLFQRHFLYVHCFIAFFRSKLCQTGRFT